MLRPRTAGVRALLVPLVLAVTTMMACAQTQQPAGKQQAVPPSTAPQTYEESTRFLKSLPPKPAVQRPYPSISTPPIEDQAPVPLLTEAQQKKMEEDLTKLAKGHNEPKKPAVKAVKQKKKDEPKAVPAAN